MVGTMIRIIAASISLLFMNFSISETIINVALETEVGLIRIELYPDRCPHSVRNFVKYLNSGFYDGAKFYRVTNCSEGSNVDIIQGGLAASYVTKTRLEMEGMKPPIPPIQHEKTNETGILNKRGTISYARWDVGTTASEFYFNLEDNFIFDTDSIAMAGSDRNGYTAFGAVTSGFGVLEYIQKQPTKKHTKFKLFDGQILDSPIEIIRGYVQ